MDVGVAEQLHEAATLGAVEQLHAAMHEHHCGGCTGNSIREGTFARGQHLESCAVVAWGNSIGRSAAEQCMKPRHWMQWNSYMRKQHKHECHCTVAKGNSICMDAVAQSPQAAA